MIPQPLYCYRQRSDSISGNLGLKSLDFLAGNEERLYFIEKVYPEYVTLMADKLWKYAFICTRYSDRKEFRDALNRISVQFFPLFSKKLKCSIIDRFSKDESKFIRKPFLFMLRVYEFFTVKRLKTISFN